MRGSFAGRRCSAGARQCALRRGLRVAKGVVRVGQRQEHVNAGTRMQAPSTAAAKPAICWARHASTAGPPESAGREGADLKCSQHICAKHNCRAMRLAGLLASTGPSHGRGLTGRCHARWRVSLARLKASPGTCPGQQPRRRAGERETASWQEEDAATERASRPSRPSFERSRRSSSAAATRLVADVLELVADVVLACQCLRIGALDGRPP